MDDTAGKSQSPLTPPVSVPAAEAQITLEDFKKLSLRLGTIVSAETHPNAERLLVLKVDIGEPAPRQLVAGVRMSYPDPAQLVGRQVVVVANLKPAMLRGVESQGMVLAASDDTAIALVSPDRSIKPGSTVK